MNISQPKAKTLEFLIQEQEPSRTITMPLSTQLDNDDHDADFLQRHDLSTYSLNAASPTLV